MINYKDTITYDELYKSMIKCKRNVQWKDSTANFVLHSVKQVSLLSQELNNETYKQRVPYIFKITSPKPREILSVPFRDRIYQRSLNDNIIYPAMTISFIYDNCACQYGKGNQFARKRLVTQLRRMIGKYGTDLYVLQIDIHGFYKNLRHDYINGLFKERLDPETYKHVESILSNQYQGDGYNPGSQMVQIAGVSALDKLDHYVKEQLHVECYVHYMDDLVCVTASKEHAEYCKQMIQNELSKINLEFNRKKTHIYSIQEKPIDLLGSRFSVTKKGKVLQIPLPSKIKNAKRKYKHMVNKSLVNGMVTVRNIEESYRDFRTCIEEGDSFYACQRMDKYYLNLWKGRKEYGNEVQFITDLRKKAKRRKRCKSRFGR